MSDRAAPLSSDAALQPLIALIRKQMGAGDHLTATAEELAQFVLKVVDLTLDEVGRTGAVEAAAPPPEKCGERAQAFIPRWGMSWACVLPKGHGGEHQRGGTCFAHGDYVGERCPSWPSCVEGAAPAPPPPDVIQAGYATLRDVVSAFLKLADVRLDTSPNASFTHREIERLRAAYDNDWGGASAPTPEGPTDSEIERGLQMLARHWSSDFSMKLNDWRPLVKQLLEMRRGVGSPQPAPEAK